MDDSIISISWPIFLSSSSRLVKLLLWPTSIYSALSLNLTFYFILVHEIGVVFVYSIIGEMDTHILHIIGIGGDVLFSGKSN